MRPDRFMLTILETPIVNAKVQNPRLLTLSAPYLNRALVRLHKGPAKSSAFGHGRKLQS